MNPIIRKRFFGLLVGLAGGLSFAFMNWGLDAFALAGSHAAYPWIKFIPGLLLSLLIGGLAGWLTIRVENAIFGVFFWLGAGLLFSTLTVLLPLHLYPGLIPLIEPALQKWLNFPTYGNEAAFAGIVFGVFVIVAFIIGAMENSLVEHAAFSTANGTIVLVMLAFMLVFGVVGIVADLAVNAHFRVPLRAMDTVIQFAVDNQNRQVDNATARHMYLGSVSGIRDLINQPRRLFILSYSDTFDRVDILVDFNGQMVDCAVMSEHPSTCWAIP